MSQELTSIPCKESSTPETSFLIVSWAL